MTNDRPVIVVGGGPAGLMAAETLAAAGCAVDLYEAMPSVGRKFLMAGRGGLNLTHSEALEPFLARYGTAAPILAPLIEAFDSSALRDWAHGLGIATFVGTSGRVFPEALKASPLLRAWLARLDGLGVRFHARHRWIGFEGTDGLRFETPGGPMVRCADAAILALGGASWPRLGADGAWQGPLQGESVSIAPLRAANCGLIVPWSVPFAQRWAGTPLKTIALRHRDRTVAGEAVVTMAGIEGGAVYALGAAARDGALAAGGTVIELDLKPAWSEAVLADRLDRPRRGASLGNFLRKSAGLPPITASLLRETEAAVPERAGELAQLLKRLPLRAVGTAPLARAISTAGGVRFDEIDADLMLRRRPGTFVAGEMLDWEAPTGGYLLQACFATGRAAAMGVLRRLGTPSPAA
ncbi:MAG TPA: TIGR03862 family flavoprotein [Aliidongia sp.]|nr:TIGR03862 family flavoprotein [Aliidongia sp.]